MSAELAPVVVTPGGPMDLSGFYLDTSVGTYNPGGYTYGEDSNGSSAARFWMANDQGGGTFAFAIRGVFDTEGNEQELPKMMNCYLYCTETSGMSEAVKFRIEAEPDTQAAGTPDNPEMRFSCTWSIDAHTEMEDVEGNSCGGTLVLGVNRYGVTTHVENSVWGDAEVTASPGGTFSLVYRPDRFK